MKQFFILLALVAFLTSCRSSRVIGKAVGRKDSTAKTVVVAPSLPVNKIDTGQLIRNTLADVARRHLNFTTFSAKLDVDYKGTDGKGHSVKANVKMYKDSAIWVSVNATVLSIEGLRLLITKDSVKLLNKLDKTYAARGIGFLQETTSLPLDLYSLQELIIGNPVYLDSNIVRYNHANGLITLLSVGQLFRNALTFSDADATLMHSKLIDVHTLRNRTADLTYSQYENTNGMLFSAKRQVIVSERGRLEVKLDFKNYAFNEEVSFPFRVPKNYTQL